MHPRLARVVGEVVRIVLDHALWRIGLEDAIGQPVRFAIAMASSLESKHICTGRWVSTERPPHQWLDRFGPVRSTHDLVSAMERIADLAAACMRAVVINGEPSGDPFGPHRLCKFRTRSGTPPGTLHPGLTVRPRVPRRFAGPGDRRFWVCGEHARSDLRPGLEASSVRAAVLDEGGACFWRRRQLVHRLDTQCGHSLWAG
jgi:hypothetical protein